MDTYDLPGLILKGANSMSIIELGPSDDSHTIGKRYERINQPPTPLVWWQVARFYSEAADNALLDLTAHSEEWNKYYDPATLRTAMAALKAIKDTVNKR